MTDTAIHNSLKHKMGLLLQEVGIETGTEIQFSDANLTRCAILIQEYMGLDGLEEVNDSEIERMDFEYE